MRTQLNRIVVIAALVVLLPAIIAAEALRGGAGRRVARRGVLIVARLCGVRFVVLGGEDLDSGAGSYVFVPNHSSPIDIPAMLVACPQIRFVAAADLFKNPVFAAAMRAVGSVPIARRDPGVAREQLAELAARGEPQRLAIFAEGGIAPRGQRLPFKSGAFRLAAQLQTPVVPVAILGSDDALPPSSALAVRSGTVVVQLLDPILPAPGGGGHRALRAATQQAVLDALASPAPAGATVP